ncbi:MAG: DUF58 domain-containing protein [Chloroflexi bacterium]|nr:DUF58 domain-containing protein [Chloroflexota bacterium]OJV96841.1 MAG: hypothetical protein BGO39_09065 [Chloroflexi bacterium 54-19]
MPALLNEEFLRKIDRLTLVSKRVRAGSIKGERRSTKRGTSVEFADYRDYTPGDDLRQVDWNIYARLERVFLKLFEEEEELTIHVLIDCSRSMDWSGPSSDLVLAEGVAPSNPSYNKLHYAKQTAAAISYMALAAMDRVSLAALFAGKSGHESRLPMMRGKTQTVRMIRFVEELPSGPGGNLNTALRSYASTTRQPGLLFLISDLFAPGGCYDGIRALQGAGHEVVLLHVLSPDEVNPTVRGDFRLVDSETGESQEVSIDNNSLEAYRREFTNWQRDLMDFCRRRSVNYIQVETDTSFEDLVLHYMRRRGIVN